MSRSPILSALVLALVLPLSVSAQTPTPSGVPGDLLSVELVDPEGDLQTGEGEIVPGPGFMDITMLSIAVEGDELLVTLEVAGDLTDVLSTSLSPDYGLLITVPGTSAFRWIHVRPDEDWAISRQLDFSQREAVGAAEAVGSRIEFRIPRSRWIAPEKLRFSAFMAAFPPLGLDLPDVRSFADPENDRRDGPLARPTAQPTDPSVVELPWFSLGDQVPDSETREAAWVSFDGEISPTADDWPGPLRSPLGRAATTERILGQRDRATGSPRVPVLRERMNGFFEAHGEAVATMPAFDGIGRLGDETMFDGLLAGLRTGDGDLVEPEDRHRSRLSAAAAGTAAFIYIAERAGDRELRSAAAGLADGFHDLALTRIYRKHRGGIDARARRGFDRMVREVLEGFAW